MHGTPIKGFWYDVGLFWMEFENRTENVNIAGSSTLFFVQNTGNTRHRGIEAEFSYDLLAPFQTEITPASVTTDSKSSSKDVTVAPPHRIRSS